MVALLGRIQDDAGRGLGEAGGRERLLEGGAECVLDHVRRPKGTPCPRIAPSNFTRSAQPTILCTRVAGVGVVPEGEGVPQQSGLGRGLAAILPGGVLERGRARS